MASVLSSFIVSLHYIHVQELPEGRPHDGDQQPGRRPKLLPQLLQRAAAQQVGGNMSHCHSFVKIVTGFIWLMMLTVEVLLIRKWLEHASPVSGDVTRWNSADEDNFTQVGDLPSFYLPF